MMRCRSSLSEPSVMAALMPSVERDAGPSLDFFVRFGNIQNPVPASQYFDTKPYLDTVKA